MIIKTIPDIRSLYFIKTKNGGYSPCIDGNPSLFWGSTLNNCVGGAWGLFAMAEGNPECKVGFIAGLTYPQDAGSWAKAGGLDDYERGTTPKAGSLIVWSNHVAYVTEVLKNGDIKIIESSYGTRNEDGLWFASCKKKNNYFRSNLSGEFKTFIYPKEVEKKSDEEIAKEVINGQWGNYPERKKALEASGYDYSTIQKLVNQLLNQALKSNEEIAREVIEGKWGNGQARKQRLTSAGYNYTAIQTLVNKLIKEM